MSSNVVPENTDMMTVVQPLINTGCLEKVISESGGTVIKVFGNWKNTIGNYNPDQGYKVKLTCDTDFSVKGFSMMSQSNMYATSQSIPLTAGWNIISYPYPTSQDAMTAFQSLIDSGNLIKVIDETGATLIKVFGNWRNNIGDFKPGEGYEIKVTEDTSLMLKESTNKDLRGFVNPVGLNAVHFTPVWTGNPYNPMNLWVSGVNGYTPSIGDEIALFDGDKCVGSAVVNGSISEQNPLQIIASQDDGDGKGFADGNAISLKYWDSGKQTEITPTLSFTDKDGSPIATPVFTGKADYGVTLTLTSDTDVTIDDVITALKILVGMNISPANTNADADNNGKIEMKDVLYILQKLAGMR